jgi:ABC-type phosphate transport system substrate-binding protein
MLPRLLLPLALAMLLLALPLRAEGPPAYRIIVSPEVQTTRLERRFVRDAFLKKTTRWPGGEVIHPVDLPHSSPVRRRFSEEVLERSVEAVRSYWQQVIFSGRGVPPPELASDEEVVRYVVGRPGAIGYVSGTAPTGNARIVTVY